MTTLREISKSLNTPEETDFFEEMMDIDIGDYTFTDRKQYDDEGYLYLYSNKNNPNVKLLFNEERASVILYELQDDNETVNSTVWRYDKKFTKKYNKNELKGIF